MRGGVGNGWLYKLINYLFCPCKNCRYICSNPGRYENVAVARISLISKYIGNDFSCRVNFMRATKGKHADFMTRGSVQLCPNLALSSFISWRSPSSSEVKSSSLLIHVCGIKWQCCPCDKSFSTLSSLLVHELSHDREQNQFPKVKDPALDIDFVKYSECSYRSSTQSMVARHFVISHILFLLWQCFSIRKIIEKSREIC